MDQLSLFPTVKKLAAEAGSNWDSFELVENETSAAERRLREALSQAGDERLLNADVSLVLSGSFARYEMLPGSDYDWTLLVDGVVDNEHAALARLIQKRMKDANLPSPGSSGTFGNMVFSHDLVHAIGGGADSNANLTRRILMVLESRPFSFYPGDASHSVWENVLGNILERYFEEDVHFNAGHRCVPRFLLNDVTRYWRTICVDYAAKHREQDGNRWAVRNAKLRFSRKLLYSTGLAFCLSCHLDPPSNLHSHLFKIESNDSEAYIAKAKSFARTPSLEYLAAFVDLFVADKVQRTKISELLFGTYNWWLSMMSDSARRTQLENLSHEDAADDQFFQEIREKSTDFATGLELLFFDHDRNKGTSQVANLCLQYIGF